MLLPSVERCDSTCAGRESFVVKLSLQTISKTEQAARLRLSRYPRSSWSQATSTSFSLIGCR